MWYRQAMSALPLTLVSTAAFLGLAIIGEGGASQFFSHPPLIALTLVTVALAAAALFTEGHIGSGVRENRENRWVIGAFAVLGFAGAYVPAFTDRIDFLTFGGEGVRWSGVGTYAIGGVLRLAPVFVLGRRFSGLVAIQPGHRLVTTGIYGLIRHPSYLGLLVTVLGWGLAFRAGFGVVIAALMLPVVIARIELEERLLNETFGAEYEILPRAHLASHSLRLLSLSKGCLGTAHPLNVRSLRRAHGTIP